MGLFVFENEEGCKITQNRKKIKRSKRIIKTKNENKKKDRNINLTDNKIKEIYRQLIDGINKICQSNMDEIDFEIIKSQMFNVILVLSGTRSGMLYEMFQSNTLLLKINKIIIKLIKKIIKKHYLNNIQIENIYGPHYVIYDNKYKDLVLLAHNDDKQLGILLDFICPGDNQDQINDRMVQDLYANECSFITQICSVHNYESNKDKFNEQFKKYQRIGNLLSLCIKMRFRIVTGAKTLITEIHKHGTKAIIKYMDELINIMRQGPEEDYKKTIDHLNQGEHYIMEKEKALKIIIINAVINDSQMSNSMIENILLV